MVLGTPVAESEKRTRCSGPAMRNKIEALYVSNTAIWRSFASGTSNRAVDVTSGGRSGDTFRSNLSHFYRTHMIHSDCSVKFVNKNVRGTELCVNILERKMDPK